MQLKPGDLIAIRHYSVIDSVRTVVGDIDENGSIIIKLSKEFASFNFFEGEPVVIGYEQDSGVFLCNCTISTINIKQSQVKLDVTGVTEITNKRMHERFPISIYADIKKEDSVKKINAVAKDISSRGIRVCTKADIPLEEKLDVSLYMDKKVIFLVTRVIWKSKTPFNYDYGMEIIHMDYNNHNLIKQTLRLLKKEQEDFIMNMRNTI